MPSFCQVALSTLDLDRACAWYRELGFLPSGGRRIAGERVAALAGLPEFDAEVRWLVGRDDFFQLELFRFARPEPQPLAAQPERGDEGYVAIGVHVPGRGPETLRDPDGVLVQLLDGDPGARLPAVRRLTLGVPDVERAVRFWRDAVGLAEEEGVLWGGEVALELVSVAGRRRRDGYRISDQGIINVAVGGPDLTTYEQLLARTCEGGYRHHGELHADGVRAVYLDDDQGTSVELLYRSRQTAASAGFEPL
jgi:catechol 2,3-dioxygenase-like lactoylglutathione lyase family enzyme